jgi:3-deoxy-D-manno-octulosonate 8-phosphate phosphatase (KDO 8-P phosphatase)
MTNNTAIMDQYGNESVIVNRSDGLAISEFRKLGIEQLIISTEENPVVQKRAEKLKINCISGVQSKLDTLKAYLSEKKINKENVTFVGNDINDLEVMKYVGFPVAPNDAYAKIKEIAVITTFVNGGQGVIRELFEILVEK